MERMITQVLFLGAMKMMPSMIFVYSFRLRGESIGQGADGILLIPQYLMHGELLLLLIDKFVTLQKLYYMLKVLTS